MKMIVLALLALVTLLCTGLIVALLFAVRHQGNVFHYDNAQGQILAPNSTGNYYAGGKQPTPVSKLPAQLSSQKARTALDKLVENNYLNADYSLAKEVSSCKAAIIAKCIMDILEMEGNNWRPFEELWQIGNMRSSNSQALNASYHNTYEAAIRKLLLEENA